MTGWTITPIWMLGLGACASAPHLSEQTVEDAALIPADEILEMSVDPSGRIQEIEFHTTAEHLPEPVRRALERELPSGVIVSCEKEYSDGELYWEVEKNVDGLKREIMFTPEGEVFSTEFEIPRERAPKAVLDAGERAVPGGEWTSVEEVREAGELTYHLKKKKGGLRYKIILEPDGTTVVVLREIPAEVEVPVR